MPVRLEAAAHRALAASSAALLVALGCIALFLPPLAERTLAAPLRTPGPVAHMA